MSFVKRVLPFALRSSSSTMAEHVKRLESTLNQCSNDEEKVSALLSIMQLNDEKRLIDLQSDGQNEARPQDQNAVLASALMDVAQKHGLEEKFLTASLASAQGKASFCTHLDRLECGNHDVNKSRRCGGLGSKACSACHLVSYCSQTCQKEHWKLHKRGRHYTYLGLYAYEES